MHCLTSLIMSINGTQALYLSHICQILYVMQPWPHVGHPQPYLPSLVFPGADAGESGTSLGASDSSSGGMSASASASTGASGSRGRSPLRSTQALAQSSLATTSMDPARASLTPPQPGSQASSVAGMPEAQPALGHESPESSRMVRFASSSQELEQACLPPAAPSLRPLSQEPGDCENASLSPAPPAFVPLVGLAEMPGSFVMTTAGPLPVPLSYAGRYGSGRPAGPPNFSRSSQSTVLDNLMRKSKKLAEAEPSGWVPNLVQESPSRRLPPPHLRGPTPRVSAGSVSEMSVPAVWAEALKRQHTGTSTGTWHSGEAKREPIPLRNIMRRNQSDPNMAPEDEGSSHGKGSERSVKRFNSEGQHGNSRPARNEAVDGSGKGGSIKGGILKRGGSPLKGKEAEGVASIELVHRHHSHHSHHHHKVRLAHKTFGLRALAASLAPLEAWSV